MRWYAITACLLAVPPVLALLGVHFPQGPPDVWVEPVRDPDEMNIDVPSVAILYGRDLLQREIFVALHEAIAEIRAQIPDADVIWLGDAPDRVGLLREPRPVVPDAKAGKEEYDRAFETLKSHPLVAGQLLSRDSTTMMIILDVNEERLTTNVASARQILTSHLNPHDVVVRMTGNEVLVDEHQSALEAWRPFVMGSAALVVTIGSLLMLGSFRRAAAVGAGPGFGVVLALGWHAFLGLPQNDLATSLAPVFVLVLAFTDSLHIYLAVEEEYSHDNDAKRAVRRAMKRMLRPCFLTSLTTSIAFASLMISDESIVFGFGRNTAVATMMGFLGVVTIMPIVAADCVRRLDPAARRANHQRDRSIRQTVVTGIRHPVLVTVAASAATVFFVLYAMRLEPDDRIDLRLSRSAPSYQGLQLADEHMGGLRQITVLMDWPESASDETLWEVMSTAQQQISDSQTFSEPLSILNSLALLPGRNGPRKMRFARRLARDRMADYWDTEGRHARFDFRIPDRGSRYFGPDLAKLESLHREIETQHPGFHFRVLGIALRDSINVNKTIRQMAWSVPVAAVVILAVIWIAYGRLTYVLLCILPNAFALAFTMAFRAAIDRSLDISSACAASICLGLAVDDTIHFLEALRHAPGRSRRRTLHAGHLVGRALMVTSVSLFAGFVAVALIPLPTHQYFALMVCAMLPMALLGDLMILPAVLTLGGRLLKRKRRTDL